MFDETIADLLQLKPDPLVVAVSPAATVTYAVCLMNHHEVGAVLVMNEARLAGIFTERDVLRRVIEPGLDPRTTLVEEVLTVRPLTIGIGEPVDRAVEVMTGGHFRHLPIVAGDEVRGMLSMRDLNGWLIRKLLLRGGSTPAIA
jgi:CBS domain-containing protein